MTQHIAVLGLETMEGRVVLSGVWGIESFRYDDYPCQTVQIASAHDDGGPDSYAGQNFQGDSEETGAATVIKSYYCPTRRIPIL